MNVKDQAYTQNLFPTITILFQLSLTQKIYWDYQ